MAENIDNPTLKAITKWKDHPSILAISSQYTNIANFSVNFVSKEDLLTEIKMLDLSEAIQESDIPVKIMKAIKFLLQKQFVFILTIIRKW